jgi:hypothetical protein
MAIIGDWIGTRTDPWDPSATVLIHFDASGSYTAHCAGSDPSCSVWHYGTDADLPNKTYALYDLHANGTSVASIQIAFSSTEAMRGTLDGISLDSSATSMSFDFYPSWLGMLGPVHFALKRQ